MSRIRTGSAGLAIVGLAAGTMLALSAPAQATGYLTCESGTSIFCTAPSDAASPGNEVWTVSPYASGLYSSEIGSARGSRFANFGCTAGDRAAHRFYYFWLTYTDTSNTQQTVDASAQCLQISP
ncbi:MAG TPA: hypothetical protein VFD94_00905 [Jatrophihabitans sp.]|jgi:hypothetical protein|nr:hypothetical protein [Jatrophihabitans sp.]